VWRSLQWRLSGWAEGWKRDYLQPFHV